MNRKIWLNGLLLIFVAGVTACKKNAKEDLGIANPISDKQATSLVSSSNSGYRIIGYYDPFEPQNNTKEGAERIQKDRTYLGVLSNQYDVDYYVLDEPMSSVRIKSVARYSFDLISPNEDVPERLVGFSIPSTGGKKYYLKVTSSGKWNASYPAYEIITKGY